MSNLTDIKNDIFISYAHIDNTPVLKGKEGWIANFHDSLAAFVAQIAGETPKIWRDTRLGGSDFLSDEINEKLSKSAVLVCVLSQRYIESKSCLNELNEFVRISNQNGGIRIGNKSRIFKILKFPVDREDQPAELQKQRGHDFFQIDEASGKPREFRVEFGPEAEQAYLTKVSDLAYDICEVLKKFKTSDKEIQIPTEKTVYLAETTSDLDAERDKIRAELQERGCSVLPNKDLASDSAALQYEVQEALEHSAFSIHMIGKKYGAVPKGETRSIVHLQNILAAERLNNGFSRLIWLPQGLQTEEERQQKFIEALLNNSSAQKGADVLQVPLEELKTVIRDKLASKPSPSRRPTPKADQIYVYLICDQVDYKDTAVLEDYLFNQGYEVVSPDFDQTKFRETHTENLLLCDAAIIYYGKCSASWVRSKIRHFSKVRYGKTKPFLSKAVYLAAPETEEKRRFRTHAEALIIKNFAKFSPDLLKPFINQIGKGMNGKS